MAALHGRLHPARELAFASVVHGYSRAICPLSVAGLDGRQTLVGPGSTRVETLPKVIARRWLIPSRHREEIFLVALHRARSRSIVPDSAILRAGQLAFPLVDALCLGGTGGIRTPGPVKVVRFQGGCIRPLCHRSVSQVSTWP